MEDKRIRLVFEDDDILSESQKLDGLNCSWVLLKPRQHDTVLTIASHLLHAFRLHQSCPHGILLSLSGFVLPPFESSCIIKDGEIIRIRKRRDFVVIAGNNAAHDVDKRHVDNGVLLLANEEFGKEKAGYESDDPEEDDDHKSRKRKAPERLRGSKKKKQRAGASDNVDMEKNEDSLLDVEHTKNKSLCCEDKKDDSNAYDNVEKNEGTSELSGKSHSPVITRNNEVKENGKETEDATFTPKDKKKLPSRSARRCYAKRRWLKEMANIQKQNANCESEGLRNWREDQAKSKSKTDACQSKGQSKGQQKWNKHQADSERNEGDDEPKGLLHWKQSPQENRNVKGKKHHQKGDFFKHPNQNDDVLKKPTENDDELGRSNGKLGDIHDEPCQDYGGVQEKSKQNRDASEVLKENNDEENEIVVPVVVRPGYIRFEPLGKEQDVQQTQVPSETFQWNGITSKKKGQQWGKENNCSFISQNDYKNSNEEPSEILAATENEKQPDERVDFDKLPPLTNSPQEGDLIAYRIVELSSTWTPEISSYRVGKVSSFNAECNQIMLAPVPEYPIISRKSDNDEDVQLDTSLYKEDGSLEIDFVSLIDVRIVNNGSSGPVNGDLGHLNEGSLGNDSMAKTVLPDGNHNLTVAPNPETGVDVWEQLGEALSAKKEQLSKENGWGQTPKKVQPPPENSRGKGTKKVQPSPKSNWGKTAEKVQQSYEDNCSGKHKSGGKSWSYKGLRGGGLGSTMAILRSKNEM